MDETDLSFAGTQPVLIIPDVHADAAFVHRVFTAAPPDQFGKIVFLGDYFDGRQPGTRGFAAASRTAILLRQLSDHLGDKLVLLWGNHDLAYYAARGAARDSNGERLAEADSPVYTGLMPESRRCLDVVHQTWGLDFWQTLRPFYQAHGHLLSHAGLHQQFWDSTPASPHNLLRTWQLALHQMRRGEGLAPLLTMGPARGGPPGNAAGVLWQDWDDEFGDTLDCPQIVGHTAAGRPRHKGRSWCLDASQQYYAVLDSTVKIFDLE